MSGEGRGNKGKRGRVRREGEENQFDTGSRSLEVQTCRPDPVATHSEEVVGSGVR